MNRSARGFRLPGDFRAPAPDADVSPLLDFYPPDLHAPGRRSAAAAARGNEILLLPGLARAGIKEEAARFSFEGAG